jgi:hypothetical protein
VNRFNIAPEDSNLRHSQFNKNKNDPGPLWPDFLSCS